MKANRTVAVCDILGFSRLVETKPLDIIVDRHIYWLRKALLHSIHKRQFPEEPPTLEEIRNQGSLGLAWFSDTILIYTLDDTEDTQRELLACLGWLLFETMFEGYTRIRCGVSYGEVYLDVKNSLYLGKPIIEAFQLEEDQSWSGGALTPKAVERLPSIARSGKVVDWFVVPYDVPLKQGGSINTLAIDWTIGIHASGFDLFWSSESAEPSENDWIIKPDICMKWLNTRAFHKNVCRICNRNANRKIK